MELTPLQGLVMGTRSGDVDPGLHTFLHDELGMTIAEIDTLLNTQSGLKGMAGVNDFRELEQHRAAGDNAAQLAFEVGTHRLKHYLGAYLALLGRLDVLSFTAGVGENNLALGLRSSKVWTASGSKWTRSSTACWSRSPG